MPVTASYSGGTRRLSALGDAASNTIIFSRDVGGTLFVTGDSLAVTIAGGPATVLNTDLIEAFGLDLNDIITLDETNGAMPAATLNGGNGADLLTGGSNGDTLNGDAGVDTLFGRGGIDVLNGGVDGDTLTGGDADDTMNGEDGNDRMIWNPGDDNDVMEGGPGNDVAEVNGGNGAETFTITANGTRVDFDRVDPAPFTIDIGTTESLVLNANGGDDVINTTGNLGALISLVIDGGAGNDTITGGNGADVLVGGDGNDLIDGNQGLDTAFLGAGNDTFKWDPGDGSDTIEGQADTDELLFNGSNASENINIVPNGARVLFTRDVAAITMDMNDVEEITYRALSGLDNIVVADMTGTDLVQVVLDLAGGADPDLGDGVVDSVTVTGTAGADTVTAAAAAGGINVTGLSASVSLTHQDATDRLVLFGNAGDDVISASGIPAGIVALEMLGGLGGDIFIGSDGNDLLNGGDGNDTALMGAGDDSFTWNPGDDNDTLEGQAGTDTMDFNGSAAAENITINPNGGRILFFRDIAAVTMDLNDVERIVFDAGAGADSVILGDLSGTDAALVTVNLAGTVGGSTGDSTVDAITANGTGSADTITIAGAAGAYTVAGLPYTLAVNQSEAADTLAVIGGFGADVISAAGLAAGTVALNLIGIGGNDILTGGSGADLLQGGNENDTLTGGPGGDQVLGQDGSDVMVWNNGDGSDVLEGGIGNDTAEVNGDSGAEAFTVTANGARVRFDRIDPAPFVLDIGGTESLFLNAGGGNDTVTTTGNLAALIALTIDGGAGDDILLASNGIDILLGGDGNDFVDGQQGNDAVFLGAGNDVFQWDPGDASDTVEGQADVDTLLFNGNSASENFTIFPSGGRATLTRDLGAVAMDLNDLEQIVINAGAGTDTLVVSSLATTDVDGVTVNLAGTIGGSAGDALIDTITWRGTDGADGIILTGAAASLAVTGLPVSLAVNQSEAADQLIVQAGDGNDGINATGLAGGVTTLTLDGGGGDDIILGSNGAETILAGDGTDIVDGNFGGDTAFLGLGNDIFLWNPGDGSDVVEGQGGADRLVFNGSNASENITISANGARSLFARDVAAVNMDMDDVETITYNAIGGADDIVINNMAGTDVTRIVINLAAQAGGTDGQADTVTINASAIGDILDVDLTSPGVVTVTGLFAVVEISNFDALDRLIINAGDGNDTIDASGTGLALTVFGGLGDDVMTGGNGPDQFFPGAGNNTIFWTPGPDFLDSVGGNTTVFLP